MNYSFISIDKVNKSLLLDLKGISNGYFFAGIKEPTTKKMKLRISKENNLLTYDINN